MLLFIGIAVLAFTLFIVFGKFFQQNLLLVIFLFHFLQLSSFMVLINIPWPEFLVEAYQFINGFIYLLFVFHPECVIKISYFAKLGFMIAFPVLLIMTALAISITLNWIAVLDQQKSKRKGAQIKLGYAEKMGSCLYGCLTGVWWVFSCRWRKKQNQGFRRDEFRAKLKNISSQMKRLGMVVAPLFYSLLINELFGVFDCQETSEGLMLEQDHSTECPDDFLKAWFGLLIFIIGFGIPGILIVYSYKHRNELRVFSKESFPTRSLLGALGTNYKPGLAWFESVIMLHKFAQLFFIWALRGESGEEVTPVVVMLLISGVTFALVVIKFDPFATKYTVLYTPLTGNVNIKYSFVLPVVMVRVAFAICLCTRNFGQKCNQRIMMMTFYVFLGYHPPYTVCFCII